MKSGLTAHYRVNCWVSVNTGGSAENDSGFVLTYKPSLYNVSKPEAIIKGGTLLFLKSTTICTVGAPGQQQVTRWSISHLNWIHPHQRRAQWDVGSSAKGLMTGGAAVAALVDGALASDLSLLAFKLTAELIQVFGLLQITNGLVGFRFVVDLAERSSRVQSLSICHCFAEPLFCLFKLSLSSLLSASSSPQTM